MQFAVQMASESLHSDSTCIIGKTGLNICAGIEEKNG